MVLFWELDKFIYGTKTKKKIDLFKNYNFEIKQR